MANCIQVKEVAGVKFAVFVPTSQMRLFAMTLFCDSDAKGRSPEIVCEAAGLPYSAYEKFLRYEPHFSEWLESRRLELGGKSKKAALEAIGMEMALKGEFQFWKPLAIREGVISPDKLEIGASIPANLGELRSMNVDDLKALENSVMASLRGESHAGEIAMVEGPERWEREGDPGGAAQVPPAVVLADELGADGECALAGLDAF